jgi:Family of unknown function (DUF6286)
VERTIGEAIGGRDALAPACELPPPDPSGAPRRAVRFFRPRRTPVVIVTATLLTAVGAAAATELTCALLGHPLPHGAVARTVRLLCVTAWNDPGVSAVAGGVALAGALLLAAALVPGHGRVAAMAAADRRCLLGVERAGLCTAAEAAALGVPGIAEARARLRGRPRRRVIVHAATGYRNPGTLRELVADAVRARIDAADLVRPPRVVVRLTWRRD